jgi:hypothetical protein
MTSQVTRWKVVPAAAEIDEREFDYSATFDAHNVDSGTVVQIMITQRKGEPVGDLIGALRALAGTLLHASNSDEPRPALKGTEKLN